MTKSTPYGAVDRPFTPGSLALGAGSTFFARTIDTDPKHMQEVFLAAEQHRGTSFIEYSKTVLSSMTKFTINSPTVQQETSTQFALLTARK